MTVAPTTTSKELVSAAAITRRQVPVFLLAISLLLPASVDAQGGLARSQWIKIDGPEGGTIHAFVSRPRGDGPFPIVVVLHGTDGFRQRYVYLAEDLAKHGFVAVAACWFGGHYFWRGRFDQSGRSPHPDAIHCPDGPAYKWASLAATKDVTAIVEAARKLPGVLPQRVGLFGHSRGGVIALVTASSGGDVQAVVASAAHYRQRARDASPLELAGSLTAPVLLLNGTRDPLIDIGELQEYERRLRELGKAVEAHAYDGAPHDLPFELGTQSDVLRRAVTFFQKHLR